MTPAQMYEIVLLALCIWREARGEAIEGKVAVGCVIRNRALAPKWWGKSGYVSVILCPQQFSSFNANDPNAVKLPQATDPSWEESLEVATEVHAGAAQDPTDGATHYFDESLDGHLPPWVSAMVLKATIGRLRFYA